MKKYLIIAVIFLFAISTPILSQPLAWAKVTSGVYDEYGVDMKVDALGNVYVIGMYGGLTDFDPGPGTFTMQPGGPGASIYIKKLNKKGNFLWVKQINCGSLSVNANSLVMDRSNNLLITGSFGSTIDFDPGSNTYNVAATCNQDGYVLKLDSGGNFIWVKAILGTNLCIGKSISRDASNNVLVTGYFAGAPDFDPGIATYTVASKGGEDVFALKLDSLGNFIWAKGFGGTAQDRGNSITCDNSGNPVICGSFSLTADFDPGLGTLNLTSAGMEDFFVLKLSTAGNLTWVKRVGDFHMEYGNSVVTDKFNNIHTTGVYVAVVPVDFDPGPSSFTLTSKGYDAFVQKLDSNGNFIWAKGFGGLWYDGGTTICLDSSLNVYTSGYFKDTTDFDPGPAVFNVISSGLSTDFFIQKLNSSGNFISVKTFGGINNNDQCNSITIDKNQNLYGVGFYQLTVDFDPNPTVFNLTSLATSVDAFVLKLGCPNRTPDILNPVSSLTVCNGSNVTLSSNGVYNVGWFSLPSGGTILGTGNSFTTLVNSNTTYYVQDSLSTGCVSDRAAITVSMVPTPTLNVSASSNTLCSGQSATITSTGASTYTWQPGNLIGNSVTVSPSVTTNYTVTGANTYNCKDNKTISLGVVTCAPLFTVGFALTNSVCENSIITVTANTGTTSATGYTWTSTPAGLTIASPNSSITSINANLAGTYSVTLTVASGTNFSTATNTILVRTLPNVTSSGPTLPICPPPTSQGPINLYASGANTYTWLPSSSTGTVLNLWPYPSVSTTYTVTGTDIYGCTNYTTQYVQVLPMPWVYASGPSIVCDNATNCFTAGGALWTYVWSGPCGFSAFGTAPCFSLAMGCGGTFTVGGTDGTCVGETTINIGVSLCTNVTEQFIQNFHAYPNPVKSQLFIEVEINELHPTSIEVTDLLGRVLISQELKAKTDSNSYTLNMEKLNSGIYFARLVSNNQTSKQIKLIKE